MFSWIIFTCLFVSVEASGSFFNLIGDWFGDVWYKLIVNIALAPFVYTILMFYYDEFKYMFQQPNDSLLSHCLFVLSFFIGLPLLFFSFVTCFIRNHTVMPLPHHFLGTTNLSCFEHTHFITADDIWLPTTLALYGIIVFFIVEVTICLLLVWFGFDMSTQNIIGTVTIAIVCLTECGLMILWICWDWSHFNNVNTISDHRSLSGNKTIILWTNVEHLLVDSCRNGRKEERNVFMIIVAVLLVLEYLCVILMLVLDLLNFNGNEDGEQINEQVVIGEEEDEV